MNYTENNKLIAEFMGYTEHNHGSYKTYTHVSAPDRNYLINQLRYNDDWNELMEVVEKIEKIKIAEHDSFWPHILMNACWIGHRGKVHDLDNCIGDLPDVCSVFPEPPNENITKIQAVYTACVQFIQWYNSTQQDNARK